jgi:C_GCAxxG_C_C family probable redox protein
MDNRVVKKSGELFKAGFYCAESVLLAISESAGIQSNLIPKIATGFCSGLARTSGMCGALSGAILAINLFTGRQSAKDSPEENYRAVGTVIDRFREQCGATDCFDLIGCDLATPAGQQKFTDDHCKEKCRAFTEAATAAAIAVINDLDS